jgi:hypothetical protein
MDWFAMTFSGALMNVAIDGEIASRDFGPPRRTWAKMARKDGHGTAYVKSQGEGAGTLVTWGGLAAFSPSFRNYNVTDRWVIFDQNDPSIDDAALEAALASVHGTDVMASARMKYAQLRAA